MSQKGARNHKRKTDRARQQARRPFGPEDMPRPMRMIVEGQDRLIDYASQATDSASAVALADARLDEALARLIAIMGEYYPFDVAELIHMRNLTGDPETYRETEHDGNLATVEIATLVAAAMPAPPDGVDEVRHVPPNVADAAETAAFEALEAASMRVLFSSAEDAADPLSPIGFGSLLREMSLRNTEYPHMLRDTLLGLFGAAEVESALVASIGMTIAEILAFTEAADRLRADRWNERLAVLAPVTHLALTRSDDPDIQVRERAGLARLYAAALASPADAGTVTAQDLADDAGLGQAKAQAFLDLFGLDCSSLDPTAAARGLFSGASPLRTRPIVVDGTERASVCHSAIMIAAVRPRLEEVLFAAGHEAMYTKHRGDYTEAAAVDMVAGVLPSTVVHAGYKYFVPDPKAASPQDGPGSTPSGYTKLVEGDGLVIVDDIAIVLESKAVDVSDGTRQGHLGGIRRNLRSLLTKTVEQANRTRTRILDDGGLRLHDGTWLDLSGVREVYSIAVTLEDLSGIATVTSHLIDANLIDPTALPWIVSLHDLRIITELIDRPTDLLFFLRRRTHPDVTRRFWAMDELDFFLHFQSTGLYVERDPDVVASEMPHLPRPTTADRRRFREQSHEFLTSRTGPLDDWYFHRLGIRQTPAEKPSLVISDDLAKLVDGIIAIGKPGWPAAALAMLEGSSDGRRLILDGAAEAVARTVVDGARHTFMGLWGESPGTSTVLVLAAVPTPVTAVDIAFVGDYMRAKKHQAKAALGTVIVMDPAGRVIDLLYENTPAGNDPALDALVEQFGLGPLERQAPVPPKARARDKQRRAEQDRLTREQRRRQEDERLRGR